MKFHVSADGNPRRCFADARPCPVGGEDRHYATEAEARAGFEREMQSETFSDLSSGYTVMASVQVGESEHQFSSGPTQKLPIRGGFATPEDAINWARETMADATPVITVRNEDWDGPRVSPEGHIMAPKEGEWHTLNLVDISRERQLLDTGDIPAIGKYYLKRAGHLITDVHSLRLHTSNAARYLSSDDLGRLRGYLKAATYGKKKVDSPAVSAYDGGVSDLSEDQYHRVLADIDGPDSEEVLYMDLLDEYPEVRDQVAYGGFEIKIYEVKDGDRTAYVTMADDGGELEWTPDQDWVRVSEDRETAHAHAESFVRDWKEQWGLED